MDPRRSWPAFALLLAAGLAGLRGQDPTPDAGSDPMGLRDVETLLGTGVPATEVGETMSRRGIRFPLTPAIRRYLAYRGLVPAVLDGLSPGGPVPARTPLAGTGMSLRLPDGWEVSKVQDRTWTIRRSHPRAADPTLEIRASTLDPETLRGEKPGRRTLLEFVEAEASSFERDQEFRRGTSSVIDGNGLTGVAMYLSRTMEGRDTESLIVAAFARRQTLVIIHGRGRGPDDSEIDAAITVIELFLTTMAPHDPERAGLIPVDPPAQAYVIIENNGLMTITRLGQRLNRSHSRMPEGPASRLLGDPLARRVGWQQSNGELDGVGDVIPESATRSPSALAQRALGDAAADPEGTTLTWAEACDPPGAARLRSWRIGDAEAETSTPGPVFRPAHRVDVAEDPGSDHWLVAVAGTHHPLPLPGAGPPMTVVRFLYVSKADGAERPLFFRARPGEDAAMPHSPRFSPSGWEVVYIDPELGLCVIPRDGGIPVQLWKGATAVEPWLYRL